MSTKQADRVKLLAALEGAARLSRTEISYNVFGRNRTMKQIDALLADLAAEGLVSRTRIEANGHRDKPIEMWEVISYGTRNGHDPDDDGVPPAGEGWLPRQATIRKAEAGVMPASAERVGKRIRRKKQQKGTKLGPRRSSDEALGAAYLIRTALYGYRRQGVIEVQGDWIRLVKNPSMRPPRHWHEALLQFVAEGHPTLDGKWRRKPKKTLSAVMEDALGRSLEPHEQVRRKPGMAGSWNGDDIVLLDFEEGTITTLAEVRARPVQ